MRLTKHEALTLIKTIHKETAYPEETVHQDELRVIQHRLENFVCYGDEDEADDADERCVDDEDGCEEEEDDEEAADDDEDAEEPSDEDDEEDAEDEDAAEDAEKEDGDGADEVEEEEPAAEYICEPDILHDLTPSALGDLGGTVEFEQNGTSMVDVLVDGYSEFCAVRYLKRSGKELHARSFSGQWRIFTVKRWAKGWNRALPAGALVEVGAE